MINSEEKIINRIAFLILSFILTVFLLITSATIVTNRFLLSSDGIIGSLRATNFHENIHEQIRDNLRDRIASAGLPYNVLDGDIMPYYIDVEMAAYRDSFIEEMTARRDSFTTEIIEHIDSPEEMIAYLDSFITEMTTYRDSLITEMAAYRDLIEEITAHTDSSEVVIEYLDLFTTEMTVHMDLFIEEMTARIILIEEMTAHVNSIEELSVLIDALTTEMTASMDSFIEEMTLHIDSFTTEMTMHIDSFTIETADANRDSVVSDDLPNTKRDLAGNLTHYINGHLLNLSLALDLDLTWIIDYGIIANLVGEIIEYSEIDDHLLDLGLTWAIENGIISDLVSEITDTYSDYFSSPFLVNIAQVSNMFVGNLWQFVTTGVVGIIITMGVIFFVSRHFAFRYFAFSFGTAALMMLASSLALSVWGGNRILGIVPEFVYDLVVIHIERTILSFLLVGTIIAILYVIFIIIHLLIHRKLHQTQVAATQ